MTDMINLFKKRVRFLQLGFMLTVATDFGTDIGEDYEGVCLRKGWQVVAVKMFLQDDLFNGVHIKFVPSDPLVN